MKRLFLFSHPMMKDEFAKYIFPIELKDKKFAYMPTNGHEGFDQYVPMWQEYVKENGAEFIYIDNTKRGEEAKIEAEKILSCNILMSTGGNTFQLLHNLRESGLFETIKQFVQKDEFIFTGFSAGAIIMTPSIAVAGQPAGTDPNDLMDENIPGITDLTALGLVNFEVYPHYNEATDKGYLENYQKQTTNEVKALADEDYILIDL